MMKARAGDHIVIFGHRIHEPVREGEVLEARGPDGTPPLLVKWRDTGRVTELFPGPDASIVAHTEPASDGAPIGAMGAPARTAAGEPSLPADEAVTLVRRHLALERIRSSVYDHEIWTAWKRLVGEAAPEDHNSNVLDRLLEELRDGG